MAVIVFLLILELWGATNFEGAKELQLKIMKIANVNKNFILNNWTFFNFLNYKPKIFEKRQPQKKNWQIQLRIFFNLRLIVFI